MFRLTDTDMLEILQHDKPTYEKFDCSETERTLKELWGTVGCSAHCAIWIAGTPFPT